MEMNDKNGKTGMKVYYDEWISIVPNLKSCEDYTSKFGSDFFEFWHHGG